jgi:hypothetical protein
MNSVGCPGDHHRLAREVAQAADRGGGRRADAIDDVHARGHASEHRVAVLARVGGAVVQEGVVDHVDKELGGGAVDHTGACHGDGAAVVAQSVGGLVLDRGAGGLLLHVRAEASALDHEVGDHAVEDQPVVVSIAHVGEEVFGADRRVLRIELELDGADRGLQEHAWRLGGERIRGAGEGEGREQDLQQRHGNVPVGKEGLRIIRRFPAGEHPRALAFCGSESVAGIMRGVPAAFPGAWRARC